MLIRSRMTSRTHRLKKTCSMRRNVATYIASDYIVRQTKKIICTDDDEERDSGVDDDSDFDE